MPRSKKASQIADFDEPSTSPRSPIIMSLARGIAVLESFDTERQRLNATTAAQRTGITRAAARRCLLTLANIGYLETDGSYFWLGPRVLKVSGSYLASARMPRVVQHSLDDMSAKTGESFSAAVLDGGDVVVIARSGPVGAFRAFGIHLGARLSAHATSTGRMLLADFPRASFDDWIRRHELRRLTQWTIVQEDEFRKIIALVRQQDYCIANDEHELGISAIAVPLRDLKGRTIAALNSILLTDKIRSGDRETRLLRLLQDTARELRPLL